MSSGSATDQVKGKAPAAATALVKQALGRPSQYFYGQLYHQPEVQALRGSAVFDVLHAFTYGTFADFAKLSEEAKAVVTPNMLLKLKRLTLVTLAQEDRHLSYDKLFAALDVADGRELEDLVIDAATEGLLSARIDQQGRTIEVAYAACRDVRQEDVPALKAALTTWSDRCARAIRDLDQVINESRGRAQNDAVITRGIVEAESVVSDECKKELIAKEHAVEDEEFAPTAARRR